MPDGQVSFVGAGPGDPGLLTLRGRQLLAAADVVLYDYLVNPALLEYTRPNCERVCLGRHGPHAGDRQVAPDKLWTQDEINARLVADALAGKQVVRLKSGDPTIFGRLAEECAAVTAAGIRFEVVPGITAALAAGAYAGVWVTNRDTASAVALITGHEQQQQTGSKLDYEALARFPGTLVFYMGVTTIRNWSGALLDAGKAPDTPVIIVRRCGWPDQWTHCTTLARVGDEIRQPDVRPPVIAIVGDVARSTEVAGWFAARPLHGRRIVVTRPIEQNDSLTVPLRELGAECLIQPTIEIRPVRDSTALDAAIDRAANFRWIVFSSANGVKYFLDRLQARGYDARKLGNSRLAVIGPGTATALRERGLIADLQPNIYRAEALAAGLLPLTGEAAIKDAEILLVRASRGREVLAEMLAAAGARITQAVAYESTDVAAVNPQIEQLLAAGAIDWITVSSSAIARSLVRLCGTGLRHTKLLSISPLTSATLRECGFEPTVEATEFTTAGMIAALLRYYAGQTGPQALTNRHKLT